MRPCRGCLAEQMVMSEGGKTIGRQSAQSSVMTSRSAALRSVPISTSTNPFAPEQTKAMDLGFTNGLAMAIPVQNSRQNTTPLVWRSRKAGVENMGEILWL